jgi:hypothetical protein
MYEVFNVYIAGLVVNIVAGFIGWYLIPNCLNGCQALPTYMKNLGQLN